MNGGWIGVGNGCVGVGVVEEVFDLVRGEDLVGVVVGFLDFGGVEMVVVGIWVVDVLDDV